MRLAGGGKSTDFHDHVYQNNLKENVQPSLCDLKLKHTLILQQDNDPKHTSKSTSELPCQSPDWDAVARP